VIEKLIRWRYRLLLGFFALWMILFDSNNVFFRLEIRNEIAELEEQESYYIEEIEKARTEREHLFGDLRNLERFAREHYLMKKENEDLFIIVEPEKDRK